MTSFPKRVCVRAFYLRQLGYENLPLFVAKETNALVCRSGRVFVKQAKGLPRPYHYKTSPWANPFVVGKNKHTLEDSLFLYKQWLDSMLQDGDVRVEFKKLLQKRNLGCFCVPTERCHVDIILEKLKELFP